MGERTTYTAEYKSKIVIEILQGEHTISEIHSKCSKCFQRLEKRKEGKERSRGSKAS